MLGSPQLRPVLAGVQTNLYMVFMDTVWRHLRRSGTAGLLHPESHFTDPAGGALRRADLRALATTLAVRQRGGLLVRRHQQQTCHSACRSTATSSSQRFLQMCWASSLPIRRWLPGPLRHQGLCRHPVPRRWLGPPAPQGSDRHHHRGRARRLGPTVRRARHTSRRGPTAAPGHHRRPRSPVRARRPTRPPRRPRVSLDPRLAREPSQDRRHHPLGDRRARRRGTR